MHLLTTYCQDTMANFGCMRIRSIITYLPIFQGSFPKYTQCNIFSLNARPVTFLLKLHIISFMSVLP